MFPPAQHLLGHEALVLGAEVVRMRMDPDIARTSIFQPNISWRGRPAPSSATVGSVANGDLLAANSRVPLGRQKLGVNMIKQTKYTIVVTCDTTSSTKCPPCGYIGDFASCFPFNKCAQYTPTETTRTWYRLTSKALPLSL